ncbi:hypothetical protein DPMN_104862 [Dreissena polymorpha]|uniref:Uncharacterized protein n=1 Tax=Dreissena polymorpha TaxID=45954 RepID=A0A9D4K2W9_DREPO|nr:hypothetical protein DPMN_104862 [Dreissena polymorpha]
MEPKGVFIENKYEYKMDYRVNTSPDPSTTTHKNDAILEVLSQLKGVKPVKLPYTHEPGTRQANIDTKYGYWPCRFLYKPQRSCYNPVSLS